MKNPDSAKKSLYLLLFLVIALPAALILWLNGLILRAEESGSQSAPTYRFHYAMVVDNSDDSFWDMVYEGAQALATEQDAYLELMQNQTTTPFSLSDQLNMAFAARVDGIFIASDGSAEVEVAVLRNARSEHPIPLLTVLENGRLDGSFGYVGIDDKELGRCYSDLVLRLAEERSCSRLAVLGSEGMDADGLLFDSLTRQLTKSGLLAREQIREELVDTSSIFSCKRDIRPLLSREDAPDLLICPDYLLTMSACQVAVEQNLVGKITLLGSYASDEILSYVQKGTLYGTVAVDPKVLGAICLEELNALKESGESREDVFLELITIDSSTARKYRTLYAQGGDS